MSFRPTVIAGNWKMHKTISEALLFVHELAPLVGDASAQVYLAVPFTCLSAVAEEVCETKNIKVGAQNISSHPEGAWTGEISERMAKEAGANFVLLGHSERRSHYHESSQTVNEKLHRACDGYLQPIVCVGETWEERKAGREHEIIEKQIRESLLDLSRENAAHLILAYEPVWAIGTGKNATPEDAQAIHHFCRAVLESIWDRETAQKIPLLYGGSVKLENASLLLTQPDIDGLLVGGASLNANSFSQIVHAHVNP